jgi:hypothetical protein
LHALNRKNALDIPGWEGEFPRFEDFSKYAFQTSWFRAEGQIIAAEGDVWIGLGAVGYFPATNSAYNMHTGVLKAYRGRHIARARGADYIRTNNDSHNAPILAVNQSLGYQPQLGFFKYVRVL